MRRMALSIPTRPPTYWIAWGACGVRDVELPMWERERERIPDHCAQDAVLTNSSCGVHANLHLPVVVRVHICAYLVVRVHICAYLIACVHICTYLVVYVHICAYLSLYACMCTLTSCYMHVP
ncbi:hypothetical protein C8Q70DRAFT_994559 [Cubamyces menziesii]|nr:hypothetical protein C8Q70DRAFT_994559 [Cubamyces menziesii]